MKFLHDESVNQLDLDSVLGDIWLLPHCLNLSQLVDPLLAGNGLVTLDLLPPLF